MADTRNTRETLYEEAALTCGAAIERLARAYEADPDKRKDLLQEIHVALWRSLENFEGRCALKTWVYRVAHNTATSVVLRPKLNAPVFMDLDEAEGFRRNEGTQAADHHDSLERIWALIQKLRPTDKQVILLYLEGLDASSIGDITGFSSGNVATKIHRIKNLLFRRFHEEQRHGR